ncbi:TadE/TadG family type IV pilus assembly protein [Nocardioides pocheonensis]|jgi:Flp pilus assembly protein TadG|nr:TadE/TadG family type IV pilus assembly protein [Nocardioides pocheonensis]
MAARRSRDDRGAAAVEFALIAPFLFMLLFGMITTGLAYNDHVAVANAVREGARLGSALDYTQGGWATSVRDRVKQTYFNSGSTLTDAQICVKIVDSTHNNANSSNSWTGASCGTAPDLTSFTMATGSCAVVVWVKKPETILLVVAPTLSFDIGAKSVTYYGRTQGSCTAS